MPSKNALAARQALRPSVPPVEGVCDTFAEAFADAFPRAVTPPRDGPPRA
ncbi:hypothetical protein L1I79_11415 [Strepomyces sp. STD 3.1]|nr:hypothetical protein [Streptomyces sp. STD 3.1]